MRYPLAIGVAGALALAPAALGKVWCVDAGVSQSGDGGSWYGALKYLQDALNHDDLAEGDQIWVAAGTYFPDQYAMSPQGSGDPASTFDLVPGVELYGGFPPGGGGGSFAARDPWQHLSILSGHLYDFQDEPMELCGNPLAGAEGCFTATPGVAGCLDYSCCQIVCDDVPYCCVVEWDVLCVIVAEDLCAANQAQHVVTANGIGERVRIDGFFITGGSAVNAYYGYGGGGMLVSYNGDVIVANCTFADNFGSLGGAMYFNRAASVVNCRFLSNQADKGGAVYIGGPPAVGDFVNCTFMSNLAEDGPGGAVYLTEPAVATLSNCTLLDNFGTQYGRALYKVQQVTNSIVWGSGGNPIADAESVTYSCVQGGHDGEGNISDFPLFLDPLNDDYRLAYGSPCVDAGIVDGVAQDGADLDRDGDTEEPTPLDLELVRRVIGDAVDMGASELCPYDVNHDGMVGIEDFLALIGAWGSDPGGPPDFDADGVVGIMDFLTLLGRWNACG